MVKVVLSRAIKRSIRWWARHRSLTIRNGVGLGMKFNIRNASANYIRGTNEEPVQNALAAHLKPGDTFYDIGANVGFFTIIGARLVGPSGRVCAFEPIPENAAGVERNAKLNDLRNITVYEKAVTRLTGKGRLIVTRHPGGARLDSPESASSQLSDSVIPVDLVSIDELIEEGKLPPPTVVKIDVEGEELKVLHGMTQTIKEFTPTIIYEVDDQYEEVLEGKNEDVVGFFSALGYQVKVLEEAYPGIGWKVRHGVATPIGSIAGGRY